MFARRGFHHCRVSDVADEAGVAYGLVYHYFDSKEEILNTLFPERWQMMLDAIAEIDARDAAGAREAVLVAGFIIDSYRHEPGPDEGDHRGGHARGELLRRAPTSTRSARPTTDRGDRRERPAQDGSFKADIPADFAAMCFYGAIEQLLSGWIFGLLPQTEEEFERAKGLVVEAICGGSRARAAEPPRRLWLESRGRWQTNLPSGSCGAACSPASARSPRSSPTGSRRRSGYGCSRRTRPTTDGRRAESRAPPREHRRSGEAPGRVAAGVSTEGDAFAERPEAFVGAAFAGGLALALILRRLGRE